MSVESAPFETVMLDSREDFLASPLELNACLNSHGLYDPLRFVLRLSPELHRITVVFLKRVDSERRPTRRRGRKVSDMKLRSNGVNVFTACACSGLRLLGGINVKFAVALLALAFCAGTLRGQQTLTVNKLPCAGSTYIASAANLPNAGGVASQCGTGILNAILNDPVV